MFSDMEFIDYRYLKRRPFRTRSNGQENVVAGADKRVSEVQGVVKKKRPCTNITDKENRSRGARSSGKRSKLSTTFDYHSAIMSGYDDMQGLE